jgi:hypothetical protein
MFTENRLSTTLVASPYTYPYTLSAPARVAYAMGGIALSNPNAGLNAQLWTATVKDTFVELTAPNQSTPINILQEADITELTLAFDQNMNVAIAYVQYGQAKLYWYDTFIGDYTITALPGGSISPRVTLDDRRELQTTNSDIILGYVLNDNLYFRMQRERYLSEHLLRPNVAGRLVQMGMNTKNRLQFQIKPFRTS